MGYMKKKFYEQLYEQEKYLTPDDSDWDCPIEEQDPLMSDE